MYLSTSYVKITFEFELNCSTVKFTVLSLVLMSTPLAKEPFYYTRYAEMKDNFQYL